MVSKSKGTVCAVLVMLLLASYDGGVRQAEARGRVCTGKSQHHSWPCALDRLCSRECIKEGWTAGYCNGFRRQCYCQKPC